MKHKFRVIPKEEVLANRSNAYEFIDFNKKNMKLISMTDFVLEQEKGLENILHERLPMIKLSSSYDKILKYANFLKQPLKLEMFVPCDADGNVLEKPEEHFPTGNNNLEEQIFAKQKQYQKAKEKVLFEGWFIHFEDCVFKLKDGCFSIIDLDSNYTIEDFCENEEESRILTQNAIKQLGL
jgi:hypothetical protein